MRRGLRGSLALGLMLGMLSPLVADEGQPPAVPRPAPGGATAPS